MFFNKQKKRAPFFKISDPEERKAKSSRYLLPKECEGSTALKNLLEDDTDEFRLLDALSKISLDFDSYVEAVVRIYSEARATYFLLKWCIQQEIDRTERPEELFRSDTIATKILATFCRIEGDAYLRNLLEPSLRFLENVNIEVDPARSGAKESVENNVKDLILLAKELLGKILNSATDVRPTMKYLFHLVNTEVAKKFPENAHVGVSGLYFLRFLNPTLVNPDKKFTSKELTPQNRRSLILLSKIVQNVANRVEFGDKEGFMKPFNSVILEFLPQMNTFLDKLSDFPSIMGEPKNFVSIPEQEYHVKVREFCDLLKALLPRLKTEMEDDDFWAEVCGVVDRTINGIDRSITHYNLLALADSEKGNAHIGHKH